MKVRVLRAVAGDLAQAASWYDRMGSVGLGDRFIEAFYVALGALPTDWLAYRVIYAGFRRVMIKPFPYIVYFREFEKRVTLWTDGPGN